MKKKLYNVMMCTDCVIDFAVANNTKRGLKKYFCPLCGDYINVKYVRPMYMGPQANHRRRWTKEEDDQLIYMKRKGLLIREIVEAMDNDRTHKSIARRVDILREKGVNI